MQDCVKAISKLTFNSVIIALLAGCATPTTPDGGPRDNEGPKIISTEPETGTTDYSGRTITFHFSEFVNRSTLPGAITIEPEIGIGYETNWGRKSVEIEFERALPDLTTVIITIGTALQDLNGNKLSQPVKVAVSTGPEIDEGELVGRIIDARTGERREGRRVLLFRRPTDISSRANYSAETDTSGRFRFSYLRQGTYKAIWIDDRNRNKTWEPERERAQPFPGEFIDLEKNETDSLGTVYIAQADTAAPALQGVGLFSSRRLRLRFSENIRLTDSTGITISDTLGNAYSAASPLYIAPSDSFVLFARSVNALAADQTYRVEVSNISDSYDNTMKHGRQTLTGTSQSDTTRQRIIYTNTVAGLFPGEFIEILYAAPVTGGAITDSLKVVRGTELIEPWEHFDIQNNRLIVRPEETRWRSGISYEFRAWSPSRRQFRKYTPTIWYEQDLGGIAVQLAGADSSREAIHHLRLKSPHRGVLADTVFSSQLEIENLPPVSLQLIVFRDQNGNGIWDAGSVQPYMPPEPYYIRNDIPVREGFISDITVHFN